jgi:hypothetical protein
MQTHICTIGSACGRFVEYQWLVVNSGKIVAQGFADTIEQAKAHAAKNLTN